MPQSRQTSFSLMPVFRISFRVEDRENYDVCVFNQKVHCKWKAAKEGSTYGFVDFGELLWFTGNCMDSCVDGYQKLRSKSLHSFFIPVKCFSKFRFGFRTYDQCAFHDFLLIRSRTSDHGDPTCGSRW